MNFELVVLLALTVVGIILLIGMVRGWFVAREPRRMHCGVCGLEVTRVRYISPLSDSEEAKLLDCGHTYLEHTNAVDVAAAAHYEAERARRLAVTKARLESQVLVIGQTDPANNGIYIADPVRVDHTDPDLARPGEWCAACGRYGCRET